MSKTPPKKDPKKTGAASKDDAAAPGEKKAVVKAKPAPAKVVPNPKSGPESGPASGPVEQKPVAAPVRAHEVSKPVVEDEEDVSRPLPPRIMPSDKPKPPVVAPRQAPYSRPNFNRPQQLGGPAAAALNLSALSPGSVAKDGGTADATGAGGGAAVAGGGTDASPADGAPAAGQPGALPSGFVPRPYTPPVRPLPAKARKVRGGVKLPAGEVAGPTAWAAQRWLRLTEMAGEGQRMVDGLDYARQGQTKRIDVRPGVIEAYVQGRADRPYVSSMKMSVITLEQWDRVVMAMSEGAMYSAKLLAGELPSNIEEVFIPLGLKLFPAELSDVEVNCTCSDFVAGTWCKHLCCTAYLLGHKLASEPFLMFSVRGLEAQDLLERLRQRRAVTGAALGATPVYQQRVPGVEGLSVPALQDMSAKFWDVPAELRNLDLPIEPPQVSHPLLRRLGPSPFPSAQFPLVGLLASCYESISSKALDTSGGGSGAGEGAEGEGSEG